MHINEKENLAGMANKTNAKQQGDMDVSATCCDAGSRRPSLCEEAEHRAANAHMEGAKAYRAVSFFREHPEFDEFIQLVRAGVIQI